MAGTVVPPLTKPLSLKDSPLICPDLRCTEILKYYEIYPLDFFTLL
jgi:hypothetical protein